ncbi:DUF2934 domain-containing protein [Arcicella aquatica]|uniref:DUF2934 domain-containing protein n=1 Tax=Arcicella aquatica TaxID=217141 RepID=A0ABU5QSR0_9BACT|nr:DUF2934 domain-containing protein [Arcicella aquatica]MEA5260142.1 DUF2934 domain-containing protein [Arcicella aquatica]
MLYDITMCKGGDCPKKHLCYRYTADIEGRQDFFPNLPFDFEQNTCEFYWQDVQRFEQIKVRAYDLWLDERRPRGRALDHWLKAENECIYQWSQWDKLS